MLFRQSHEGHEGSGGPSAAVSPAAKRQIISELLYYCLGSDVQRAVGLHNEARDY